MTKEEAHRLIDQMPDPFSCDDLIDEFFVRQVIEKGLADSEAGRTKDVREIRSKFGIEE